MLGAEKRDPRLMLERAARRNNLDVDALDLLVGERPRVLGDHLLDNCALAHWLINLTALEMLESSDFRGHAGASRHQPQDFEIYLVHPRAQSFNRRRLRGSRLPGNP